MLGAHLIILLLVHLAAANVEKTIFVAPAPNPIPPENRGHNDLGLERLSPSDHMVRTMLNASFPTEDAPRGTESWFYLEDLHPGRRYEVRICWLATVSTVTRFCIRRCTELLTVVATNRVYSHHLHSPRDGLRPISPCGVDHIFGCASRWNIPMVVVETIR